MSRSFLRVATAAVLVAAAACHPEFNLKTFTTNEALYTASFHEYQHHHWDNAISGFEKLTTDLSARDTLLPLSYWYLGQSHDHNGEHLLAAQSYSRLVESFPDDSLADDAALESARAYAKLWRKPELDPVYGETALSQYNTLIGLYPKSPLIPKAQQEIARLENWFAIKDYDAGMFYFRRKAFDSADIYFKDVLAKYATTPTAKDAALRLVESYKAIHYRDDAIDLCTQLRQRFPTDRETGDVCRGIPNAATATADSSALKPHPDTAAVKPAGPKPPTR